MLKILGRIGFGLVMLLSLVAMASVLARGFSTYQVIVHDAAAAGGGPHQFEERYAASPWLTLAHVLAGFLFIVTGPLQFLPAIRNRWRGFHRFCGKVFMAAGVVGACTALAFLRYLPVYGTFTAKVAVVFGAMLFLFSIVMAYVAIRQRRIQQHREWMIRAYALGLGIATFRVFLPIFMSPPFSAPFAEAWDTVTWFGFALNLTIAEAWINLTRPPRTNPLATRAAKTPAMPSRTAAPS